MEQNELEFFLPVIFENILNTIEKDVYLKKSTACRLRAI